MTSNCIPRLFSAKAMNVQIPMMVVNIQDSLSGNVVQVGCSNNSRGLYSKISQDARLLDNIAGQISTIQSRRAEIKHHSSYRIEKKGYRDSRRRKKSSDIGISDEETENMLRLRHQEWVNNPSAFWLQSETFSTSQLPPIAQIASYHIQAQRADV